MKNIIFDIGNVILKYDPLNFLLDEYKDIIKITERYELIFKSKEWIEFDRGTLSYEKGSEILSKNSNISKKEILYLLNNWKYKGLIEIESTRKFIEILKENDELKLYLLSNFHEDTFNYIKEKYPIFDKFDGDVISYQYHYIKPERKIYEILLDKYKLNPKDTIFIDDSKANINKAKELGIKGILYKNEENLVDLCETIIK